VLDANKAKTFYDGIVHEIDAALRTVFEGWSEIQK
jgi:hypothetical protein